MSRTVTVTRPRILLGFMLNFLLRMGEEERVLTNGSVVTFEVSSEAHTLTIEAMNNPNITDLAPLTIPAGTEDAAVQLSVQPGYNCSHWYLELV